MYWCNLVHCLSYVIYVSTNFRTISKIKFSSLNPFFSCGSSIESTSPSLLPCLIFKANRQTLLTIIYLTQTLLLSSSLYDIETDTVVLNATSDYILFTKRCEKKKHCFHMQFFNLFRNSIVLLFFNFLFCFDESTLVF